jgi:tryptophan 2,3-dioxygenase
MDKINYTSYLKVDELLNLQHPQTTPEEHDETLFIIIHQVYELWFKQVLHEATAASLALKKDEALKFLRYLKRITCIQDVLIQQINVLETMTPNEFNRFREKLNPASGFQSVQWRELEYHLGAKYPEYTKFHLDNKASHDRLTMALESPTLYDNFLHFLSRQDFKIPGSVLNRDVTKIYEPDPDVQKALLTIYQNSDKHHDLFLILEAMLDMDQKFLLWRYRHVSMVERMIGSHRGTGGSSGVKYLLSTMSKRYFPEIWEVRNALY